MALYCLADQTGWCEVNGLGLGCLGGAGLGLLAGLIFGLRRAWKALQIPWLKPGYIVLGWLAGVAILVLGVVLVTLVDTGSPSQVRGNPVTFGNPAWSPDGTRIAFASNSAGKSGIYLMDPDGSTLTRPHGGSDPAWSPDGRRIVLHWDGDIYLMDTDGRNVTHIHEGGSDSAWSPDGTRIAFVSRVEGKREIFLMDADGSNVTRFSAGSDPAWSPDGGRIAFIFEQFGRSRIYVRNVDGSDARRLGSHPADGHPTWSPDGTRIAFECDGDIWVMDADGSHVTRLTGHQEE